MPKEKAEHIVDNFSALENPTQLNIDLLTTQAQVQYRIELYRSGVVDLDEIELEVEKHISSRLVSHLEEACDPSPNKYCHTHAIVAGKHPQAVKLRAILAWNQM